MSISLEDQYDKIYKYCYFKVKNKEIAEDLTQETFLKYFAQNSYISRGKQLAYLYTIAKNQCTDYFRKQQSIPLEEGFIVEDSPGNMVTNLVVRQAVDNLPHELAEVVLLRFSSEMGINEIALFLGISRFAVHRKINTALKEIKIILREEDFYE
ncbi:MAG: RNA polymerase sigma factor [Niameybacter sp.]|uniref:RNA polymerase sigma factor n=1 Tax=Niameybacter sp. TaxID=2033640 RepID=UPI002FC657E0